MEAVTKRLMGNIHMINRRKLMSTASFRRAGMASANNLRPFGL
jgi:hypothetical protein